MIDIVARYIIPAAYAVLPPAMASDRATAMLLAIGAQESGFAHRVQIRGPARSLWQFEPDGIAGVLNHPRSKDHIRAALRALLYDDMNGDIYHAIAHNDVLGATCARCLLWTDPHALPEAGDVDRAWNLYLDLWRPGHPRPEHWIERYAMAWGHVTSQDIRKA